VTITGKSDLVTDMMDLTKPVRIHQIDIYRDGGTIGIELRELK
jgi:hypothetical protein